MLQHAQEEKGQLEEQLANLLDQNADLQQRLSEGSQPATSASHSHTGETDPVDPHVLQMLQHAQEEKVQLERQLANLLDQNADLQQRLSESSQLATSASHSHADKTDPADPHVLQMLQHAQEEKGQLEKQLADLLDQNADLQQRLSGQSFTGIRQPHSVADIQSSVPRRTDGEYAQDRARLEQQLEDLLQENADMHRKISEYTLLQEDGSSFHAEPIAVHILREENSQLSEECNHLQRDLHDLQVSWLHQVATCPHSRTAPYCVYDLLACIADA